MRPNLVMASMVLAIGVVVLMLLSKSPAADAQSRKRDWIPSVALISGPLVGIVMWAADVFFFNSNYYVLPSDTKEAFIASLSIGTFVGFVTAVVLAVSFLILRAVSFLISRAKRRS